jgi:hypothetical protein
MDLNGRGCFVPGNALILDLEAGWPAVHFMSGERSSPEKTAETGHEYCSSKIHTYFCRLNQLSRNFASNPTRIPFDLLGCIKDLVLTDHQLATNVVRPVCSCWITVS